MNQLKDPGYVPADVRLHRRLPAQEGCLPRGQVPRPHRAGMMMTCITLCIRLVHSLLFMGDNCNVGYEHIMYPIIPVVEFEYMLMYLANSWSTLAAPSSSSSTMTDPGAPLSSEKAFCSVRSDILSIYPALLPKGCCTSIRSCCRTSAWTRGPSSSCCPGPTSCARGSRIPMQR